MKTPMITVVAAVSLLTLPGCDKAEPPPHVMHHSTTPGSSAPSTAPADSPGALSLVTDPSLICMVNNQFMGQPQIPIAVNGKTYYGCCEMCKDRLANDPASRIAVDPMSQRPVDKSMAVIGKAQNGTAMYFENEQNLVAYSRQGSSKAN